MGKRGCSGFRNSSEDMFEGFARAPDDFAGAFGCAYSHILPGPDGAFASVRCCIDRVERR